MTPPYTLPSLTGTFQDSTTALSYLPHHDNVVLSPFSLISCMAMLCRGATLGPARGELAHYCWPTDADAKVCDDADALPALSSFVRQLADVKVCRYANILMTDHGNVPEYTHDILEYFKAKPYTLDDYETVNTLVRNITTIPKKVVPRQPGPKDGTVLINAVYFADKWSYQFEDRLESRSFKTPTGSTLHVDMMHQKNRFPLAKHGHMTAVHLPYQSGLGAWFVKHETLHTHEGAYWALQQLLELEFVNKTLPQETTYVDLTVPKFTMNSSMDLIQLFSKPDSHKITHVFNPGHLTRMSKDTSEYVGRFVQECILEVDQKGTVAAAYSASQVTRGSRVGPDYKYVSFTHTFYMVIHHNDTILFVAKVASPTPSAPPAAAQSHKVVQIPQPKTTYDPWQDLEHNIIIPFSEGEFLLIIKAHKHKNAKGDEIQFITSFNDTDNKGQAIEYANVEGKIMKTNNQNIVYKRTYEAPLDWLLRVQIAYRNTNKTSVSVMPVYVNLEGKQEPERLQEMKEIPWEIPFPLQKEEGEGEDGWDFKDKDGKIFFQLRFIPGAHIPVDT